MFSIWCNLTGSYRCRSPLSFGKSITNKHFIDSLKLQDNVTTNDAGKVDRFEEEDIACDLDMHSLIIGSYEQELDNEGGDQQAPGDGVQSADQVIEEIEKYIDGDFHPGDGFTKKADGGEDNPLLSLNASTLLNVVLKSWEEECAQSGDTSNTEGEYYSLPAHINHTTEPIANNSAPNEGDHQQQPQSKEVSLTLKASNIYLNAKMSSNAEYEKIYKKNNQIIQENQAKTGSTVESECLERLRNLNTAQLNELYIEIEAIISFKSEILCQELARRDELEFEKELKNKFISILLSVQNKRRNYFLNADLANNKHVQRKVAVKRRSAETSAAGAAGERKPPVTRLGSSLMARALDLTSLGAATLKESLSFGSATPTPVFLTTVIPYRKDMHPIDVPTMQMLIKRKSIIFFISGSFVYNRPNAIVRFLSVDRLERKQLDCARPPHRLYSQSYLPLTTSSTIASIINNFIIVVVVAFSVLVIPLIASSQ